MTELHSIGAAASWVLGDNHGGFPAAFAQFARAASPAVAVAARAAAQAGFDAMWQGAAVALALVLSLRFAPRVSAAHRFAAWSAGFALVAALPFLPLIAHLFSGSGAAASLSGASASPRPWLELDSRWALAIAALWLAGSALRLGDLIFHTLRLRKLWKTATPVSDESLTESLTSAISIGRRVEICTTSQLDHPSVIGFFSPRVLIPNWLYARLTPQELEQVVLHEAEHLRRHDDWTNLIQKFVLVLFPLSPALAWIERRLCREREMACDEGVVQKTQAPRAYAACLASLAERGLERDLARRAEALSLAAWRRRPELVHRVHGILWRKPALSPAASGVLVGVVGCALAAGSVELARCPQLLAFAVAPQPQELAQTDGVNTDPPVYAPVNAPALASNSTAYHMVPAVAILPSTSPTPRSAAAPAAIHRTTQRPATTPDAEIATREAGTGTAHETLLRAEMPSAYAERPSPQDADAPQYFVLTAVERVLTVAQNSREIADYDIDAANDQRWSDRQTANAGSKPAAAQIVVTRLIFRIEPAASAAPPGPDRKPATDSKPAHQPAVIHFGNGWLVLQL
jgi:beta-lactamase regulating signal transducer with metallopeptidase domain